jgi:hypothetical protein
MWARKVSVLGPVAEWRRHPPEIAVACEWLQEHGCELARESDRARMPRHPGESARAGSRPFDVPWPLKPMFAGALFPAQMQEDARDIDLNRADVLARAA